MINTEKKTRAILVSHTHWDRAWYLPFESFRFRLVYLIDRVIQLLENDPAYKCFVLDGQTVLIEDYLEIKPEMENALKRLISDERLVIGPWYVLPDLFLVSGESVIRNLQYGRKMCNRYGYGLKVGYVPDPFGHIAQLPQILNGMGLDTFIFMRGMPEELASKNTLLFHWKGQDDESSVLSYYLKDGYYNAAALGFDTIQDRYDISSPSSDTAGKSIKKTKEILSSQFPERLLLLNNGADHMPEQMEIPDLIKKVNQNGSGVEVTQGSFSDFMDEASKLEVSESYKGNLIGNPDHPILLSVYSTRVYLKQQNHRVQSLLEKIAEPFLLLDPQGFPDDNSRRFLDYAWKTVLKNHPHDDICGCSTDAVHEENEVRFQKATETAETLIDHTIEKLTMEGFRTPGSNLPEGDQVQLVVFNPHPVPLQRETIEQTIHYKNPGGKEEDHTLAEHHLRAFDSKGRELNIDVESSRAPVMRAGYISHQWGRQYAIRLTADLPALGYELITVVATHEVDDEYNKDDSTSIIENDRAKLSFQNGQLQWESKTESLSVENLIQFEYVGDEGDTYTFSPVDGSREVISKASLDPKKSARSRIVLTYVMEVPAGPRSSEKVTLSIEVTASLRQDGSVALRADYRNEAENGRLRMLLPTLTQRLDSIADGHFTLNRRKQTEWLDPKEFTDRYKAYPGELQYPTHYQGDFCFVEDGGRKTWVANKGLHEYEILGDGDNSFIAVTLHRSVGYLSVSNGKIRRPQAGPSIPTPGAQCKRRLSAELCWGTTDDELSALMLSARSFAHPPFSRQLPVIKNAPKEGPVPASRSLLTLDNPMIQLSSLHAADQDGDVILRLYNPSEADQTCSITIGFSATEFCESTLREAWRDETKQTIKRGVANIALKSNQIKTLRFRNDPSV